MTSQGIEVSGFIVRGFGFPTAVQNPRPFERQSPYRGLMRGPLVALLAVVRARPERTRDGLAGPLNQCLAQKRRTLPPPMHPGLLATAFGDRSNPGASAGPAPVRARNRA